MLPETRAIPVGGEDADERLDVFLATRCPELSRSQAQRLIDEGAVLVDGRPAKANERLRPGQSVTVTLLGPPPLDLVPEDIPLAVLYEDADLLVIDKPAGMLTHPGGGEVTGTLVNALLGRRHGLSQVAGEFRPGIVHRLDRDTTGLLVVAKNDLAHRRLADQLRARTASREYLAIVYGEPAFTELTVDAPIGRHPNRRTEMAVRPDGREARTHLTCLERYGIAGLLAARLETGRTHQVRVHCAHIGHPLMGDTVYGLRRARSFRPLPEPVAAALAALPGQALHAARLTFRHPTNDCTMAFTAPPPAAFQALLEALRHLADA